MTEEQELAILLSAVKRRKEAIELYERGNRQDLLDRERKELEIIQSYLPKQETELEILHVIKRYVAETGARGTKDLGKVMPLVMRELRGKADGKLVQKLVRKHIES